MKAASLNELKQELITLPPKALLELCLRLARFKKENKELLSFILFEAHNEEGYVANIKQEINDEFWNLPRGNMYIVKKGLRKVLRSISKYSKLVAKKESEAEILIHFCNNFNNSDINFKGNKALSNLYNRLIKKLTSIIDQLHEDLKFDYKKQLEQLQK